MRHELKTDPQPFDDVWKGTKLYEIRKDDRVRVSDDPNAAYNVGFQVGDELLLKETKYTGKQMAGGRQLEYTGREILCEVTQKLAGPIYGLEIGWCILGIKRIELTGRMFMDYATVKADQPSEPRTKTPDVRKVEDNGRDHQALAIVHALGYEWTGGGWAIDSLRLQALNKLLSQWPFSPANYAAMAKTAPDEIAHLPDISFDGPENVPYCTKHGRHLTHGDCLYCKVTLDARVLREADKAAVAANAKAVDSAIAAAFPAAPKTPPLTKEGRRIGDNHGGGQVTYYSVDVDSPSKGTEPYHAECIDIINALDMNFSEGEAFKSIWRCAAHRHPGLQKQDGNPLRDAQKVEYYGKQMQAVEKGRNGRMAPK